MDLSVNLRAIAVRAKLSEEVVWGVSLQQAQAALLPQNCSLSELVFFLNDSGALPKLQTCKSDHEEEVLVQSWCVS